MTIDPPARLRVFNQTHARVRLRFRYDGAQLWDTWLTAGATLAAPNPRHGEIIASATFVDPRTNVTYTVTSTAARAPVCLVAKQTVVAGAGCFSIEPEPFDQPGKIRLLNLTAAELRFSLSFTGSPFEMAIAVAPDTHHVQSLGMDIAATVDGVTVSSGTLKSWSCDVFVEVGNVDGEACPRIRITPHVQNPL